MLCKCLIGWGLFGIVLRYTRHIKRGEWERVPSGNNSDGRSQVGGRASGGQGQGEIEKGQRKYLPMVRYVQPYLGAYQGGMVGQTRAVESGDV